MAGGGCPKEAAKSELAGARARKKTALGRRYCRPSLVASDDTDDLAFRRDQLILAQ